MTSPRGARDTLRNEGTGSRQPRPGPTSRGDGAAPLTVGRRRRGGDRGTAIVELAIVMPLLAALLLGIIEFGWTLNQEQDVRYGAREGARIAAVNNIDGTNTAPTTADVVAAICKRMDSADSSMRVAFTSTSLDNPLLGGDTVQITVAKRDQQITGFFSAVLNTTVLKSQLDFQLEQVPTWTLTTPIVISGTTITGGVACP